MESSSNQSINSKATQSSSSLPTSSISLSFIASSPNPDFSFPSSFESTPTRLAWPQWTHDTDQSSKFIETCFELSRTIPKREILADQPQLAEFGGLPSAFMRSLQQAIVQVPSISVRGNAPIQRVLPFNLVTEPNQVLMTVDVNGYSLVDDDAVTTGNEPIFANLTNTGFNPHDSDSSDDEIAQWYALEYEHEDTTDDSIDDTTDI